MVSRFLRSYLYVFRHYPSLIGMGVIVIVVQLGWSMMMAILPLYFRNHFQREDMIGPVLLAFLGTETALKPGLGHLGDRIGRKPLMIGGCLAAAGAVTILHFVRQWYWFLPLMALNGVAAAAIWPAVSAYMGERVPAEDKAAAMSVFEGGYMVGFGLGGAAGLYLGGTYGNRMVFLIAAGTFTLALAITAVLLKGGHHESSHAHEASAELRSPDQSLHRSARDLLRSGRELLREAPMLSRLMFVYVMSQFGTTALAPIVTLYGEQQLGRTQEEMAGLFIGPALVVALTGVAMGRIADKIGKAQGILVAYSVAAVCLGFLYAARAPQPGVVTRISAGQVHVARRHNRDIAPGDVLSARRFARELARVQVTAISNQGFDAEILDDGRVEKNDRVFVKAEMWQIALLMIGLTLLLVAYSLGAPSLLGLGSAVAPRHRQGQALGLMNSAQGVGSCLGAATGPLMYKHVSPQAPVLMACTLYVVCVIFTRFFVHEPRKREEEWTNLSTK